MGGTKSKHFLDPMWIQRGSTDAPLSQLRDRSHDEVSLGVTLFLKAFETTSQGSLLDRLFVFGPFLGFPFATQMQLLEFISSFTFLKGSLMSKWYRRGSFLVCLIFTFVVLAPHHVQAAQMRKLNLGGGSFIGSLEGYLNAPTLGSKRLFGSNKLKKVIAGFKSTWEGVKRNYSEIKSNIRSLRLKMSKGEKVELGLNKLRGKLRNWVMENIDEMGAHSFALAVEKTAGQKVFSEEFHNADETIARSMLVKAFDKALKRICDEQVKKSATDLEPHLEEAAGLVDAINSGEEPDSVVLGYVEGVMKKRGKASRLTTKRSDPTEIMVGLLAAIIGAILLTIAIAAVVAPIAIAVIGTIITVVVTKLVGVVGGIGAAAIGVALAAATFIYFRNLLFDTAGGILGGFFKKSFIERKSLSFAH